MDEENTLRNHNQVKILKRKKIALYFLIFFSAIFLIWFFSVGKQSDVIKDLSLYKEATNIIENLKRDLNLPGGLIYNLGSKNSFLTVAGVLNNTNIERKNNNIQSLVGNNLLDQIAIERMNDMFQKNYFEHVSPSGDSASTVADEVGYEYISIGENIALGNFEDDKILVQAWMDSPGHRANILNDRYTEIGIAVGKGVYDGKSTWIAVQIFARPLSLCPPVNKQLKMDIDLIIDTIDSLEKEVETLAQELRELESQGKYKEYNRKVSEYNAIVKQINSNSDKVKLLISEYNIEVKRFNSCVESI